MRLADVEAMCAATGVQLASATMRELRDERARLQQVEAQISFVRRQVQGRVDLLDAALRTRSDGAAAADEQLELLLAALPELMNRRTVTRRGASPSQRTTRVVPDPELLDELEERCGGELSHLLDLDDDALGALAGNLTDHERRISDVRRRLHARIDALQAEITDRYRDGRASADQTIAALG